MIEKTEVAISALQHFMFCERQCALIHIDRLWEENFLTAKGRQMHNRVNDAEDETRDDIRICRSLELFSENLGIHGLSDVVEYHPDSRIIPIEYKKGKPKDGFEDKIQLCAQALCLEEMNARNIEYGFLYYGATRKREHVFFEKPLRDLTKQTIELTTALIAGGKTPEAVFSKKCKSCSLIDLCMPKKKTKVKSYIEASIQGEI
jgi:CRISPR-associated exonuclease Cas4